MNSRDQRQAQIYQNYQTRAKHLYMKFAIFRTKVKQRTTLFIYSWRRKCIQHFFFSSNNNCENRKYQEYHINTYMIIKHLSKLYGKKSNSFYHRVILTFDRKEMKNKKRENEKNK